MDFLGEYGVNSGQVINKAKSQVFISRNLSYRHHLIIDLLRIPEGTAPFTYLGVPIFRGKPMVSHFQYIVDKIQLRFSSWKGSLLSMAGRLQLINSIMASMVVYSFQIYEWPVNLLRRLEVWCRNFLWSGSMDKHGVPLMAWKTCCAPMDEGGLGLKQLVVLNRSLLLKNAWEIYSSTSEGCSFLRNRFWRNGALRRSYASSSIWSIIKRFWQQVIDNGCWLLGSNSQVAFWKDNVIGRLLNAYFGANVNIMKNTVSDFIHDGNWNLPPLLQLHFPDICEIISRVPIAFDSHDRLIWMPSTSGILTARDAYSFLRIHLPPLAWSKVIWSKFITPRMSMLAWKVLKG
ncbi:hypothetical protein ACLB2K_060408 [Fragaria x ananassa]